MPLYTVGAQFDERRNTSRVWPVPPDALPNALRSLARFRAEKPEHARWIEDGFPTMTDAQHFERFGEPYSGVKARRAG